jgi:hypothetical protein
MTPTIQDAAVRAAVTVAARFGLATEEPVVLADGANIVVHLRPAPVVAKVAASTPAVRHDNQHWLQRELDVSAFLAAEGAPVVPPSPELPATTHHDDGHVMSFWRYLPPADPKRRPDEETIGSMLRDLHAVLRRYPTATIGGGNLMATDRGWVWHDFEDTCSGPVAWDLAASTSSQYQAGPRVLAAYRDPVDPGQLAACEQLRRLHLTVWYNLYAERLPELAPRATELLASWPAT